MSRISMQALRIVVAIVIIGAGNGCSRGGLVIDGKHVKEVKTRWALIWGLPLPGPVWQDYYEYTDASGKQVQHGPYRSFRRDGTLDYSAFYREGKLDGTLTRFDENGDKSEMNFYDMGDARPTSLTEVFRCRIMAHSQFPMCRLALVSSGFGCAAKMVLSHLYSETPHSSHCCPPVVRQSSALCWGIIIQHR